MKVKLEDRYREMYTLEDLDHAKAVIKYEKEYDDEKVEEWARMASDHYLQHSNFDDSVDMILTAEAHTSKNCHAWKLYTEDSGNMDVWITGVAQTYRGFLKFGAYLSDIWQTGAEVYANRMYCQYYKEVER